MTDSLSVVQDANPHAALGRAVSYLMTKPAFANLQFGHWSRTLTGQINRKHYFFVVDAGAVVGFLGWAHVDEPLAQLWVEGKGDINSEQSRDGDCIVINAWCANNASVQKEIVKNLRMVGHTKKKLFAKRFYSDGRVRPLVMNVNDIVHKHIATARAATDD